MSAVVMDQRSFKAYESLGSLERNILFRDLRMLDVAIHANTLEALISAFDLGAYINFTCEPDDRNFRLMFTVDLEHEVHGVSAAAATVANISFAIADTFGTEMSAITALGYDERVDDTDEVIGRIVWELRFTLFWPTDKDDEQVLCAVDRLSAICS